MILTIPNLISFARILLVPCFLVASMRGMHVTAFVIFISAAASDTLDGVLARRLNMKSRVGAILDPVADKMLMVCGFVYYTFAPNLPLVRIPGWLTFTVFIRDFLIACFAYLMYTRVRITRFPPSRWGKMSTVLQATALGATIAINGFLPWLFWLAAILFKLSLLMTLISGWHYMQRSAKIVAELSPARRLTSA